MTIERKIGMGIAGQPTGPASDVAEVFSTHLYKGTGGALTVNNGIDLAGEGGMVWFKSRSVGQHHYIHDTERGIDNVLQVNSTSDQDDFSFLNLGVSSTGFSMNVGEQAYNDSSHTYAAWTFRKKEKFFDIVTYTGNYVAGREISHGLGGPVGMMIIKCLSNNEDWAVYHRGANGGVTPQNFKLILNNNSAAASGYWNNTAPTDSSFTVGQSGEVNGNNQTYVAYLFADNSSEDADDQMIKCGSYTGNGGTQQISLGWEPQFVMIKKTSGTGDWHIIDNMRGGYLEANTANTEQGALFTVGETISPNADGFYLEDGSALSNTNGAVYIWMAIRGEMMVEPEAATDVFAISQWNGTQWPSGFPVDWFFLRKSAGDTAQVHTRLMGNLELATSSSSAASNATFSSYRIFDFNDGVWNQNIGAGDYAWMWKRAKGFFDVVTYTGNRSSGSRTVAHSLGVVPEMIWVKATSLAQNWSVYTAATGGTKYGLLNYNNAFGTSAGYFNNTNPTDSVFTVGNDSATNATGYPYIAYLFATLAGISKVGTFVSGGSGVTVNVDCGFSNGARFVLIKALTTDSWYFWDTVRGIVAGNDPRLSLDSTNAAVTNQDNIDPYSAGFTMTGSLIGNSGNTFIFYAVA